MPYNSPRLGANLRLLREERGLMSKEVAEKAGMKPSAYSELENGRRRLTTAVLEKLATGLGMEAEELRVTLRRMAGDPMGRSPAITADESMQLREDMSVYRAAPMISNMPDTVGLARDLVSLLPREEVFRLLHEFTAAGEGGDIHALRKARALLELIPSTHPTTAAAGG